MVRSHWTPEAGDIVWLNFDPQVGREQAGRRPALVLSPAKYNRSSGLALVCPMTRQVKGYPFEVEVRPGPEGSAAILVDHLRSVDWRLRRAEPFGQMPRELLQEVLDRLAPLLGYY